MIDHIQLFLQPKPKTIILVCDHFTVFIFVGQSKSPRDEIIRTYWKHIPHFAPANGLLMPKYIDVTRFPCAERGLFRRTAKYVVLRFVKYNCCNTQHRSCFLIPLKIVCKVRNDHFTLRSFYSVFFCGAFGAKTIILLCDHFSVYRL